MKFIKTELAGVFIIEPDIFQDDRGFFSVSYNKEFFSSNGFSYNFIQDNISYNYKKGTLRGLHLQKEPFAQAKLVRVSKGRVLDVIVDFRKKSDTYLRWISIELSDINKRQIIIPKGLGHGYVTLVDHTEFCYKVDNLYSKESEITIPYNANYLGIEWLMDDLILSEKDLNARLSLKELEQMI
jgi:dTDP-4-dehydrorhamnose 3,5-epimerase